jgi:hypothetical protein
MKRLLTGALALLLPIAALATTLNPVQLLNPTGSTSGQAVVSTGASTAPAWGNVAATALAAQAANTVVANVTASSASPTAFVMPSCSASGNNLQWTNGTGFTCATGYAQLASPTFTGSVTIPGGSITNTSISGSTGSFTTLAASSTVSGAGFTTLLSPYALLASPTFTGTVTTAALTATGAITPSQTAGIVGTTTNNNANVGSVGEVAASVVTSPGSSIANNTASNITSISLTAGDWDVWGNIYLVPAGSTVVTQQRGTITTTSATIGTYGDPGSFLSPITLPAGNALTESIGPVRLSLASTTTVYLVQQTTFTTSTCTAFGQISARRRR